MATKSEILNNVAINLSNFKRKLLNETKEKIIESPYKIQFYDQMHESFDYILGEVLGYIDVLARYKDQILDKLWAFYCSNIELDFYTMESRCQLVRNFARLKE